MAVGYRGNIDQQEQARRLRAQNRTLADLAAELGVARSSVSLRVRDVPFTPSRRRTGPKQNAHPASGVKACQIEELDRAGAEHRETERRGLPRRLTSLWT